FFCSLLAPSDAILFQEGVSVKLRLPHTAQNQPAETVRAAAAATGRFAVAFPVRVAPGSGCFMKTNAPRLFFVDKEAGVSFDVFHVLSVSFPVTACATHDGGM
ncbi:hypothetical protein ACIU3C_005306, partial [Escherichia coli]|nr:hypothetical protein [Escherichia coli]EEV0148154.1 hypothetical protein [Escherichia coli]EEW3653661.1 hypothetical protein [Escherichia coli]EEW7431083.1 hypothetical protein [Escherichia coli]EEX1049107.1 hypothetical protein [Escherichia coli]